MPRSTSGNRSSALTGSVTDVTGLRLGHYHRHSTNWRTGTTVMVCAHGAVAGVDVRGGGPGTRETDLLRPENLITHVHAICLTGGSAFGLSAADGVMAVLEERGIGFPVGGDNPMVVPIVPTAVIFDLGRAGSATHRPDADFGRRATNAAFGSRSTVVRGAVGAGVGARAGGLQGGVGTASRIVDLGAGTNPGATPSAPVVVSALAVVNAVGSVIDPRTALPWEYRPGPGAITVRRPSASDRQRLVDHLNSAQSRQAPPLNTTVGVVATNVALSKAECTKLAAVAHDGLARAIRPAHSMHDGDTIFGLSTEELRLDDIQPVIPRAMVMNHLLRAAADAFALACSSAVLEAVNVGGAPSYRDLCPSAFGD